MEKTPAVAPTLNWSKPNLTVAEKLVEAIRNAKAIKLRDDMDYFESCCRQRYVGDQMQSGSAFHSHFLGETTEDILAGKCEWKMVEHTLFDTCLHSWREYPACPNLLPGCVAFILEAPETVGFLGVKKLSDMAPDDRVYLTDPKRTGYVTPEATNMFDPTEKVNMAVAIVGEEAGKPTLFTFHPGDPIQPSKLKMDIPEEEYGPWGKEVSAAEAAKLGFEYCKLGRK